MAKILLALLSVFIPLSLVSVGGGQAIVADIHRQVVTVHHWMTEGQFVDAFAVSRMAPGPGALLVTLIGWQVAGVLGAIVATLGIFGPTAFLIYGVASLWQRHQGKRWQLALEAGLRPVAAGTILAAVWVLMQALEGGWLAKTIAVLAGATLTVTRINPVLLLVCGAGLFIALHGLTPV